MMHRKMLPRNNTIISRGWMSVALSTLKRELPQSWRLPPALLRSSPNVGFFHQGVTIDVNKSNHCLSRDDIFIASPFQKRSHQRWKSTVPLFNNDGTRMGGESQPFLLADIGEGIAEVELLQWFVQEGDKVSQFDLVCKVQSDKATVEITSRYDGVIERLHGQVGDMMRVGEPLLHLSTENEPSATASPMFDKKTPDYSGNSRPEEEHMGAEEGTIMSQQQHGVLHAPSNTPPKHDFGEIDANTRERSSTAKILATPAVRKIAMDYSLDLAALTGTGPQGRVLKADVLKVLDERGLLERQQPPSPATSSTADFNMATTSAKTASYTDDCVDSTPETTKMDATTATVIPIRGYNRLMVKTMTESLQIPHMGYGDEINMTGLLDIRKALSQNETPRKISVLAFAIKAMSLALLEYPTVNSSIDMENMILVVHGSHNIGVAVDTPRGLAVPIVRDCQDRSVGDIARELERLKKAALGGQLSGEDVKDATVTLSNIGAIGGTYMSPVVTSPQVAVGAMGRIQRLPRFANDSSTQVEEAHIMNMAWAADHRALDGATLARFADCWKRYMESPAEMLLHLK